jgi:hypothetical protein
MTVRHQAFDLFSSADIASRNWAVQQLQNPADGEMTTINVGMKILNA